MSTPLETRTPRNTMFLTGSRRRILILTFAIIFLSASLGVNFIRQKYVAPIIMYHQVLARPNPGDRLAVSVKSFQRQMRFLKKHHYNVVPLETLVGLIKEKKKIPRRTLAITLDDGYKNSYTYAYRILKKYNLPATVFIIVNEVGRRNKLGRRDRLSWDEIKQMRDSGIISFGSHCLGPEPLVNIKSEPAIKKEIFDSKKIIEEKLNQPITMFSYPEGKFTDKIRKLVIDAGYKLAVVTNPGKQFPNDDVFGMKRLRISSTSDNLFVFWIETSGYYNFIREQRRKKR